MKKNFLKAAVMTLVAGGAIFGTAMVSDAANVRILPVDTAKFWAGARFDFDVEVSGAKNLENVKVDINGVRVEGKSMDGEMIDEDTEIEVTKVELSNVLVKRKSNHLLYN